MKKLIVDYVSDLHLSFYIKLHVNTYLQKDIEKLVEECIVKYKNGDVLVIAGDISEYVHGAVKFLEQCALYYNLVLYVMGNHEHYLIGRMKRQFAYSSKNKIKKMQELLKDNEKVVILDRSINNGIYHFNGFTIAGDTLWYYPKGIHGWYFLRAVSNDSWFICEPKMHFYTRVKKYHDESMKWYEDLPNYVDLIITHVPPMPNANGKYGVNSCYYTDVPQIKTNTWIYGHDHKLEDFCIGNVRFVSNPWGYNSKNPRVETIKVIKQE